MEFNGVCRMWVTVYECIVSTCAYWDQIRIATATWRRGKWLMFVYKWKNNYWICNWKRWIIWNYWHWSVKHLIQLFSGSDEFDACKWVNDFESACDSVNADDHTRLVFFRQSMKADSVAELFLRTDSSKKYSDIKANFLANFDHRFSVCEIIDKLQRITFRSTKLTVHFENASDIINGFEDR